MNFPDTEKNPLRNWRFLIIYVAIAVVFGFFLFRLFSLQIINSGDLVAQAIENRTDVINIAAPRGTITDRNGYVLARNVPSYNLVITPANLPGTLPNTINGALPGPIQDIYRKLSDLVGIPVSNGMMNEDTVKNFTPCATDLGITQIVYIADTNWPYQATRIKCNIDEKTALIIQEKSADWPGVGVEVDPVRDYPTGWLTSEIIGFLGPIPAGQEDAYTAKKLVSNRDKVGFAGVEATLQDVLSGTNGEQDVEKDAAGQVMQDIGPLTSPVPGLNVQLTIDTRLQSAAKAAIIHDLDFWNANSIEPISTKAVVIALNPKTGEILALASYPTYENNRMARIIPQTYYEQLQSDPDKPMFDYAISGEFPPGSVYKMATALGILNEGVVTPDYQIEDPGKITLLQKFYEGDPGIPQDYVCWKPEGHGMVDYLHGIAFSCDVYFYKVGGGYGTEVPKGLGILRADEYAKALGYGKPTGIELPGEASGLVPTPDWKRLTIGENWATGDTYIATIGQGYVLATPLQVLESIATIANDGKYMQPTLVKDYQNSEGNTVQSFQPKQLWDITKDPMITEYDANDQPVYDLDANGNYQQEVDANGKPMFDAYGEPIYKTKKKTVAPWVINLAKEGMRMVVTDGTAEVPFDGMAIQSAGKTGTAEYCDDIARTKNLCSPGNWPAHAWYVGYAPYDNPEIAVVAFIYNGKEGSLVAAPIVRKVMEAYFELKKIDTSQGTTSETP
ncbi:MAG: penicillin-binding protein 2 [Chloroflexi bacterium]|nr:penicillin-binding protein 2 [Chloroflexota bacterium]